MKIETDNCYWIDKKENSRWNKRKKISAFSSKCMNEKSIPKVTVKESKKRNLNFEQRCYQSYNGSMRNSFSKKIIRTSAMKIDTKVIETKSINVQSLMGSRESSIIPRQYSNADTSFNR